MVLPERLLADGTAITQDEIEHLSHRKPALQVYSPPPQEPEDITAETKRKRLWKRRREPEAVKGWRERMASEAGKEVSRRRKLTEHAHAKMKNRGFGRLSAARPGSQSAAGLPVAGRCGGGRLSNWAGQLRHGATGRNWRPTAASWLSGQLTGMVTQVLPIGPHGAIRRKNATPRVSGAKEPIY